MVPGSGHLRDMWSPPKEPPGVTSFRQQLVPDFQGLEKEEG